MRLRGSSAGFSLIETVIALFILSLCVLIFAYVAQSQAPLRSLRFETVALRTAKSELETLRADGYGALPANGSYALEVPELLPLGVGTTTITDFNAGTKQVTVEVGWGGGSSVSMTTLITDGGL